MIYTDPQVLSSQVFYAGVASLLLEKAKESKYIPAINFDSDKLNRLISIVLAGLTTAGITAKYSYTSDGLFTLSVTGLTAWGIFDSIKTWAFQYMMQQVAYKNVVKKPKAIVDILGEAIPATQSTEKK